MPFVSDEERALEHASASGPVPAEAAERGPVYGEAVADAAAPASAPEPEERQPHAADNVQTVTEKPANPRRGWWQRLINS
jgi:hypothetical protein